jgi:hypothetical protein
VHSNEENTKNKEENTGKTFNGALNIEIVQIVGMCRGALF